MTEIIYQIANKNKLMWHYSNFPVICTELDYFVKKTKY